MNSPQAKPKHIVFLFSDTGGGHRSAAEAIIEAIHMKYAGQYTTEMVDIFKEYAPPPLNRLPQLYPQIVRVPEVWGLGYRISNGRRRAHLITSSTWPYIRRAIRKLPHQHPCDLIVSVHPLANAPVLRALGSDRPPYVIVVTDLVTTHALWYDNQADLCIVPTEEAAERAVRFGMLPHKVKRVGLPVADRFCQSGSDKSRLRERFGWHDERPMVLLVGGGEGMGPLEQAAVALANAHLPISLAVIAGRNQALKSRLESRQWPIPMFVYGFVREMPDFMRAADILVTKAGPGTISEALNAGLPIIMYSRLPGQEDGNVSFVVSGGAGFWAPRPDQIVSVVRNWVEHPELRERAAEASRQIAHPGAAQEIARILTHIIGERSVIQSQPITAP